MITVPRLVPRKIDKKENLATREWSRQTQCPRWFLIPQWCPKLSTSRYSCRTDLGFWTKTRTESESGPSPRLDPTCPKQNAYLSPLLSSLYLCYCVSRFLMIWNILMIFTVTPSLHLLEDLKLSSEVSVFLMFYFLSSIFLQLIIFLPSGYFFIILLIIFLEMIVWCWCRIDGGGKISWRRTFWSSAEETFGNQLIGMV